MIARKRKELKFLVAKNGRKRASDRKESHINQPSFFFLLQNWASEFRKWLGNERMSVYTVNSDQKVQVLYVDTAGTTMQRAPNY
jgi:hypothetical protein